MQNFMNLFLKYIKWPVAFLCALFFYPLSLALIQMVGKTFSMDILLHFNLVVMCILEDNIKIKLSKLRAYYFLHTHFTHTIIRKFDYWLLFIHFI